MSSKKIVQVTEFQSLCIVEGLVGLVRGGGLIFPLGLFGEAIRRKPKFQISEKFLSQIFGIIIPPGSSKRIIAEESNHARQ